jgi:hypothetical protein
MVAATIVFIPCWQSDHLMSMINRPMTVATISKRMHDASGDTLSLTMLVMRAHTYGFHGFRG